ncbi:MAG TPA: transcriptional regulator HexR [Pseudomonadales bacterium]|nr:transcriptional regulator HexR [Pseudomonadales bacterium]
MKPAAVTERIRNSSKQMRKSERKVAEYVLANLRAVINMRIVDLAAQADVSEPTVVRFCRACGCDGFQDFKLALAQQLASSPSFGKVAVTDTDSVTDFSRKVFDSTIDTLLKVRDNLNPAIINRAITALVNANRVEFYGHGASAAVAADAQHRFFRLQVATAAYSDTHIQTMSAMSLQKGDVVVAISQSGRTRSLLDTIELVKDMDAIVIGMAPSHTPIAEAATIPICIDVDEELEIYTPLSSRIAHLAVIDVLAVGVAQRKGPRLQGHLYRLRAGMQNLRVGDAPLHGDDSED